TTSRTFPRAIRLLISLQNPIPGPGIHRLISRRRSDIHLLRNIARFAESLTKLGSILHSLCWVHDPQCRVLKRTSEVWRSRSHVIESRVDTHIHYKFADKVDELAIRIIELVWIVVDVD